MRPIPAGKDSGGVGLGWLCHAIASCFVLLGAVLVLAARAASPGTYSGLKTKVAAIGPDAVPDVTPITPDLIREMKPLGMQANYDAPMTSGEAPNHARGVLNQTGDKRRIRVARGDMVRWGHMINLPVTQPMLSTISVV